MPGIRLSMNSIIYKADKNLRLKLIDMTKVMAKSKEARRWHAGFFGP